MTREKDVLGGRQWAFIDTVALDIVPATASLGDDARQRFHGIIAHALAMRPPAVRRQFATFLDVVRLAPVLRFGVPFDRLDGGRRTRVLHWLQDCPVGPLRKGFWGLKALVFMGYYARQATFATIHYTPSTDGNAHLHG